MRDKWLLDPVQKVTSNQQTHTDPSAVFLGYFPGVDVALILATFLGSFPYLWFASQSLTKNTHGYKWLEPKRVSIAFRVSDSTM